ncbi:Integrator complex subunit 1 [Chamberlinius hualienensis]
MIPLKRGPKVKTLPPLGNLIVLGSKASKQGIEGLDIKMPSSSLKGPPSAGNNGDRKREATASPTPLGPLAKKPKLSTASTSSGGSTEVKKESSRGEVWETIAIEVEPNQLVTMVLAAEEAGDDEKCEKLLCGAVKGLRNSRFKPEPALYLSLMLLAKSRPTLFCTDIVTEGYSSLLRRDIGVGMKSKNNALVPLLAANILMAAYHKDDHWPEIFVKIYLDDALFDRIWVDRYECRGFVDNILTAFNTKLSPKGFFPPELVFKPDVSSSPPSASQEIDDEVTENILLSDSKSMMDIIVYSRYSRMQDIIEVFVMDAVRDQVIKRQPVDNVSRNLLKVLSCTCGLSEVRVLVSQRLEMWLQNPKLTRPAQELLLSVCVNCNQHHQQDLEVIGHLLKIRLKTKLLINHYLQCIKELLSQHSDNLATSLKTIIYNELSPSRNPNNMALLGVVFQQFPEQSARILSEIFQEVLTHKDDYLRALRVLFREIVRCLRFELHFSTFCLGLMQNRKELGIKDMEQSLRDRWFISITDLITLSIFLSVTPALKESSMVNLRGDKRGLRHFQKQTTEIQRDAVWWIHTVVPKYLKPGKNEFLHCLHKVLFMEQPEQYSNKDNWPSDTDRNLFLRLATEVPLAEDTLTRILLMGLSKDHSLNAADSLELADQLIRRAASVYAEDFSVLECENPDLFETIFELCVYRHPENITLPTGYVPPSLAISNLYWKAWTMLLVLAAHNPKTIGDLRSKEAQICQIEKQEILEFESHLASASTNVVINENNSLLLSQLVTLDPRGVSRRPPAHVLSRLKSLNQSLKLGHFLCRTRHPDFLLDIIQHQGASQSMPWLADLVESSEGAYDMLPVQCLCEFLLNDGPLGESVEIEDSKEDSKTEKADKAKRKEKNRKQQQLLQHLRELLYNGSHPAQSTLEVLDYFLRRLSSQQKSARNHATKGLSVVLFPPSPKTEDEDDDELNINEVDVAPANTWLLKYLPTLPHFELVRNPTASALRQACLVENDPAVISGYIQFLAEYTSNDPLPDMLNLTLDIAQMIIERTTIMNYILPCTSEQANDANVLQYLMEIFVKYVRKAREPSQEAYSWIWFPANSPPPRAYLVDTSEEALLFPDWLKIRMIRSNVSVLVDAALKDLDSSQLVLFIQSFGIPVSSVSKLLRSLDEAVEYNSDLVQQAVADKSYMAKLVEVQQQRGANHGDVFAGHLGLKDPDVMEDIEEKSPDTNVLSRIKRSSPIVVAPPPKPLPVVGQKDIYEKLMAIFDPKGPAPGRRAESINLLRSIQKLIASEAQKSVDDRVITMQVISFLSQVKEPNSGFYLSKSLIQNHTFSCPLFRLLLTLYCQPGMMSESLTTKFIEICQTVISYSQGFKSSPLVKLVCQCRNLNLKVNDSNVKSWPQILSDIDTATCVDKVLVNKAIRETAQSSPSHVEQVIQKLIQKSMENVNPNVIITAFTEYLSHSERLSSSSDGIATSRLVLDCLEMLEPEVISSIPELQNHLLFQTDAVEHENQNSKCVVKETCRPYLLASLVHQTNWETLNKCIQLLLTSNDRGRDVKVKYDPVIVLDFLWACIYIPKIWQGRDKNLPKHYTEENVLGLSLHQVIQVANYILAATETYISNKKCEDESQNRKESRYQNPMVAYLPILVRNCIQRSEISKGLVSHLFSVMENNELQSKNAYELLLHLYRQIPQLIEFIENKSIFLKDTACIINFPSQLDRVSHALLTTLADTESVREWKEKRKNVELACKKMAATHPVLLLRQLSMIAASLRGRVRFEYAVFKNRNHLAYFNSILSLLELLQPYLFRPEYTVWLEDIFDSYLDLIKTHSIYNGNTRKEITTITFKLISILSEFMSVNTPRAVKYIVKHIATLNEISPFYPDNSILNSIISAVSIPRLITEASQGQLPVKLTFTPPPAPVNWTQSHLQALSLRLSNISNIEDLTAALQDLDGVSSRNAGVLEYFADDLKRLMSHHIDSCRNLSFSLMMKYITHKPRVAKQFVDTFLSCLDSDHLEVVTSALEKLPEFVVLCQEHASALLQRTFLLSLTGSVNTASYIGEIISVLNMQAGC